MVSVRFIRTRRKNRGETKLERKRKEESAKEKVKDRRGTVELEQFYRINCVSDGLPFGRIPRPTEITFSDKTWRATKTREKNRIKGRERERERFRFHDRIWQRLIISNDADDKLWNKLWTFPRARFVSFLGSISEQMEGNGEAGERRGDDKPFPRFAPRHTLKEFLNGQITVERISNDTFERARSN